jgi:hypothetical protein
MPLVYDLLRDVTEAGCRVLFIKSFCDATETNFVKPFLKSIVERFLYPEVNCVKLGLCSRPILIPDSNKAYMQRVLKDKPPVRRPNVNPTGKKLKVLVFADVHVDYSYHEAITLRDFYIGHRYRVLISPLLSKQHRTHVEVFVYS